MLQVDHFAAVGGKGKGKSKEQHLYWEELKHEEFQQDQAIMAAKGKAKGAATAKGAAK